MATPPHNKIPHPLLFPAQTIQAMERSLPCLALLFLCMVGFGMCDFESDRAECADQLIGLSTCISFVEGSAKLPPPDCCSNLKKVLGKSLKCLCVLVKDRNEPGLGIKVNATLGMELPGTCNAPINASQCVDLLHLNPKSAEAQIFEEYERTMGAKNKTINAAAATVQGVSTSPNTGTGAPEKSEARKWMESKMIAGVLIWCLAASMIMGG